MSSPAPGQAPEQTPAQADAEQTKDIDARFGKIEHEQAEQRTLLEQIKTMVTTDEGKAHDAAQKHTEDRLANPPAETVAEQVRKAVEQVGAEKAAQQRQAEHDDHHRQIREAAERPPAEQVSGFRGKLQTVMFGRDPK